MSKYLRSLNEECHGSLQLSYLHSQNHIYGRRKSQKIYSEYLVIVLVSKSESSSLRNCMCSN